jgi:very-short-patch-repair endonuclease
MNHSVARSLRRNQTGLERKLWDALRARRFAALQFRRQQPAGPFVVDFVCFEKKFIRELDGEQHGLPEHAAADAVRTSRLEGDGFRVRRVWNVELMENFDGVLDAIWRKLNAVP